MTKKTDKTVVAPVIATAEVAPPPAPKKESGSSKMWEMIRKIPISMFALPARPLEQLVSRVPMDTPELLLTSLPSVERDEKGKVVKTNPRMVSSIVSSLDEILNVYRTPMQEARIERFEIQTLPNGMISIKPLSITSL